MAKNLAQDSFALIFGINGWLGGVCVFVYNFVVVSPTFFSFNPRQLYTIFGFYFYVLIVAFSGVGAYQYFKKRGNLRAVK